MYVLHFFYFIFFDFEVALKFNFLTVTKFKKRSHFYSNIMYLPFFQGLFWLKKKKQSGNKCWCHKSTCTIYQIFLQHANNTVKPKSSTYEKYNFYGILVEFNPEYFM